MRRAAEVQVGNVLIVNRRELVVSWVRLEQRPWSPAVSRIEAGIWAWINGSDGERLLCIPGTRIEVAS